MEEAPKTTRDCERCGMSFPSGKAFGGHWRSHLAEDRRREAAAAAAAAAEACVEVALPENPELEGSVGSVRVTPERAEHAESSFTCRVCNKSFLSLKSLAGHMRCHPERDWRGIGPEERPSPPLISTGSFPVSWTMKRSRDGSFWSAAALAAAEVLLQLSRGPRPGALDWGIISVRKSSSEPESPGPQLRPSKGITIREPVAVRNSGVNGNRAGSSRSKGDLMYDCHECDRSFATFQALGGHRSTHNKDRNRNKMKPVIITEVVPENPSPDETDDAVPEPQSGVPEEEPSTGKPVYDIDLNKLPQCDDVE